MACPVQLEPAEFMHPTVYGEGSHALHSGDRCLSGFLTHMFQGSGPQPVEGYALLSDGSGDSFVTIAVSIDWLHAGFHLLHTGIISKWASILPEALFFRYFLN